MRWHGAAVSTCATVAVLAGTVAAVAGAADADQASSRLSGSSSHSTPATDGASSAYRSSVTITLDGPAGSCASGSEADRAGPPRPAWCPVAQRLPVGTNDQDALSTLGQPQRRRTLSAGGEAWDYSQYLDEQRYAFALTTLRFEKHRLVDTEQYVYK